jgi:Ca-activated chloride channel family protein
MIPFLAYPLALLALVSVPALTAIYLLRNRFRRRQVSSLVLWQFHVQPKAGGSRVHRLQLPLLFFLELAALVLLVTAAAAPRWRLAASTRPLIVILDDSFSMQAVTDQVPARSRGREVLRKLFASRPPPGTRVILAGREPRLLGAPARGWAELDRLLDRWTCWSPSTSIAQAITLASEMGKLQADILVITDHAPGDAHFGANRLLWRAVGTPLDNAAIVNATRTANGDQDRCLVEIANLSRQPVRSGLLMRCGTNVVRREVLALGAQERQRLVFTLPASAPALDASLDPDALAADNQANLLPPIRRRVRVQVVLTNSVLRSLVERTLDATGLRAALTENPQLVIHQADSSPSKDAWSLNWRVPAKPTAYTGPFVLDTAHPLAEGLDLEGVIWAASPATHLPGTVPVVLAGNVPLLTVREDALGREFLELNLDPSLSTLNATPDWPILFWNLLHWRAALFPGLQESNARLGADILLKTDGEQVLVISPDGRSRPVAGAADQVALELPTPGIYSVVFGGSTNSVAVNPLAADESDLTACANGQWGGWLADDQPHYEPGTLSWLFALGALGVLLAHLWLLAVGKGGSA